MPAAFKLIKQFLSEIGHHLLLTSGNIMCSSQDYENYINLCNIIRANSSLEKNVKTK